MTTPILMPVILAAMDAVTWLDEHLRRLRADPGPDLLSQLVHLEDEGGQLDHAELRTTAGLLLAAGLLASLVAVRVRVPSLLLFLAPYRVYDVRLRPRGVQGRLLQQRDPQPLSVPRSSPGALGRVSSLSAHAVDRHSPLRLFAAMP